MLNHGVTFNLGSAKVCSPAIFEIYFSYHKDIWIAVTYYYIYFPISIDSYTCTSIKKSYSFILLIFTPGPLRAVGVLFSPMVSGWTGGLAGSEKKCV